MSKVITEAVNEINKARKEHGLPPVKSLKGEPGRCGTCPIATGLGIRNKTTYALVFVRSLRSAKRLANAWGTVWQKSSPTTMHGMKDYKYSVHLPESLKTFISAFDSNAFESRQTLVKERTISKGISKGRVIPTYELTPEPIKTVDHLICTTDTAYKIAQYL